GPLLQAQAFHVHSDHGVAKKLRDMDYAGRSDHDHAGLDAHFLLARREHRSRQNGMFRTRFDLILSELGYELPPPPLAVFRIDNNLPAALTLVKDLVQDVRTILPLRNPLDLVTGERLSQ